MREIPVQATALQDFSVIIDEISVRITLRTTQTGLYADVYADGTPLTLGRKCQDRTNLLAGLSYRGYAGLQLYFVDLQGDTNPTWELLGTRYVLLTGSPPVQGEAASPPLVVVGVSQTLTDGSVVLTYSGIALYDGDYNFQ